MDPQTFLRALWAGIQAFFRTVWGALTQLFHQVTGVFFFVFFAIGLAALIREWGKWSSNRLLVTGIFTAVFGLFTLQSFLKARRSQ
ncbi:MAG TPA: hypothetical protein VLA96_10320 [Terriglobales bacterium]|nr:hypothetical protein [Terriglobales bacterium]